MARRGRACLSTGFGAELARYGNAAFLGLVRELAMAAPGRHLYPSVVLKTTDDVLDRRRDGSQTTSAALPAVDLSHGPLPSLPRPAA